MASRARQFRSHGLVNARHLAPLPDLGARLSASSVSTALRTVSPIATIRVNVLTTASRRFCFARVLSSAAGLHFGAALIDELHPVLDKFVQSFGNVPLREAAGRVAIRGGNGSNELFVFRGSFARRQNRRSRNPQERGLRSFESPTPPLSVLPTALLPPAPYETRGPRARIPLESSIR